MDKTKNDLTHVMGTQLLQQLKLYAPDRTANLDISDWWRDKAFFDPEEALKIVEDAGYIVSLSKSKNTLFCVPHNILVHATHKLTVEIIDEDGKSKKQGFTTFAAIAHFLERNAVKSNGHYRIHGGETDLSLLQEYLLSATSLVRDCYYISPQLKFGEHYLHVLKN